MTDTANLFIDWSSEFHNPPWQACNDLPITPQSNTVQDLLNEAENCNPPVNYTYNGSGASEFLTGIDGVENNHDGNGYYWVYFVNGVIPNVGFGAYQLSNKDSVAWDYKHYSSGLRQMNQPDHPANK